LSEIRSDLLRCSKKPPTFASLKQKKKGLTKNKKRVAGDSFRICFIAAKKSLPLLLHSSKNGSTKNKRRLAKDAASSF
jgi:hypothetical protein